MTFIEIYCITGFMLGLEFPGQDNIKMVIDLGIVRFVLRTEEIA